VVLELVGGEGVEGIKFQRSNNMCVRCVLSKCVCLINWTYPVAKILKLSQFRVEEQCVDLSR
jgi:hypothetical protein